MDSNKLYLINKYEHNKCLLCIRHIKIDQNSYLLGFGTDGFLLAWKFSLDEDEISYNNETKNCLKLHQLNQSGINDVCIWHDNEVNNRMCIATVGDDSCLSILEFIFKNENLCEADKVLIKKEMAHASCIVGKEQN